MNFKIFLAVIGFLFISTSCFLPPAKRQGPKPPKFAWYTFDEVPKKHRCKTDLDCDGQRTCSNWKWCKGKSRPAKNIYYKI